MKRLALTGLAIVIVVLFATVKPVRAADSEPAAIWTYDPQTPNARCPSMPSCGVWLQFRLAHPWPYQAFTVAETDAEAFVIVSEPPPVFSREQLAQVLKAMFGDSLLELTYNRWPTGLDGWLEDVVLRVRVSAQHKVRILSGASFEQWNAPTEIADRLRLLHQLFYHTSDGLWLDRVTQERPTLDPISELRIPVSDLAGWMADRKRVWLPIAGQGTSTTTRGLYTEKVPGVFRTDGGVVVLVAPRGVNMAVLAADFRRFAVATDLIIGASAQKNGGLLLFGRLRQIALATLPPLRFESITGFARNPAEHLYQSYERQRIFAGRVVTGQYAGWDWAPILLSPQLDDSEFGTLLNLADQILKSWSQHGEVEYYAFSYAKPRTYPFGSLAASEYFEKKYLTTSLLFNWNTEGLATITTVNGSDVLTGDRTGALPILYRPSDSITEELGINRLNHRKMQEDADARATEAREYFATRGDPILVRVVQNVLLFQAVQSFLVVGDQKEPPNASRSDLVGGVLEKRAASWLSEIAQGKTELDRKTNATVTKFMKTSGFTTEQLARVLASPQSVERDLQRAFQRFRTSVSDAEWMPKYLLEADKKQHELFLNTCASVGGHIQTDLGKTHCAWKSTVPDSAELVFASYLAYTNGLEKMASDFVATEKSLHDQEQNLIALRDTYAKASEIAKSLSNRTQGVDLDDLLRTVLETTSATPRNSSIRTPSVVLSKNSVDVEAVGGHNIDLIPRRRLVMPTIAEPKRLPAAPGTEMAPARPEIEALGVRRTGSLLEEMRIAAKEVDGKAERWAQLQTKAKGCQCEALVVQDDDGVIYFIRNAPPPVQQAIFGKSGVIDALAGPPAVKVVRFENFSDSTVENIARSTALMSSGPRDGAFARALDGIAGLFKSAEGRNRQVNVTIERIGKEPEILSLSEEPGAVASLREPIIWGSSAVVEPTPARWSAIFGNEGRLTPGNSDPLLVRFGGKPGTVPAWLGIRVQVESGQRPGVVGRLKGVFEQWVKAQPSKPSPWADSLIELREAIRRQLKPIDLEFYYKHNKGKIRAADARSPRSCLEWCAA